MFRCALHRPPNSDDSIYTSLSKNMDQLLSSHPNSLFLICGDFNYHQASWLGVGTSLTCHGTEAKDFCDSLGLTQIGQFPDPDLNQWYPISSGSDFDKLPENICCPSSAPISSSDHVLVKVDTSLAVIREPPQRRRVWHFTQADWQDLQAAIKLLDWTPISTLSNINSSWEFFQRNLLSLMHRFIPSRLELSYPSSCPWYTEACGKEVVLKQLAFTSSWKANPTEGNLSSFHKAQN